MRESTLFVLTLAILVGLGVAVSAKVAGLFDKPPEAAKKPEIQVLVAAQNLFAGDTISTTGVKVRTLKEDEVAAYLKNKSKYLPAVASAASLRIPKVDILADQPLTEDHLETLLKPKSLNNRLMPTMRAISLSLPLDQAAGGLIQTGEWVDIMLTSTIEDLSGRKTTRTATIAPNVRVVAKRNTLWPVFAPIPQDKPLQFTVEVNPYRAALIEYSKNKGQIVFAPLPMSEQNRLEAQRTALLTKPDGVHQVHFIKDASEEAQEEEARVNAYNRGEVSVNENDLIRIFGIKLGTNAPPESQIQIEQLGGIFHYAPARFRESGKRIHPPTPGSAANSQVERTSASATEPVLQFRDPAEDCKNCPKSNAGKVGSRTTN
ncbi:MAG: Flp pilus assembly protein CpaB [Bdellovibrionales bacterium]